MTLRKWSLCWVFFTTAPGLVVHSSSSEMFVPRNLNEGTLSMQVLSMCSGARLNLQQNGTIPPVIVDVVQYISCTISERNKAQKVDAFISCTHQPLLPRRVFLCLLSKNVHYRHFFHQCHICNCWNRLLKSETNSELSFSGHSASGLS